MFDTARRLVEITDLRHMGPTTLLHWFRAESEKGRYLVLRALWRSLKSLYRFHSAQRFVTYFTVYARTLVGSWKPMPLPSWLVRRRFHSCVVRSSNGDYVVKLPRGDEEFSSKLTETLKDEEEFRRYRTTLTSLTSDPWLKDHAVRVWDVRRNGGYSSELVHGINLAIFRNESLFREAGDIEQRPNLKQAIERLIEHLASYHRQHGSLIGDWALQNMVYSPERGEVINVDAEGFYSYDMSAQGVENHLPSVRNNLQGLCTLLELQKRGSPTDQQILDVFRALDEVRRSDKQYSAVACVAGYHSLNLNGHTFEGQRDCKRRLTKVPYDFTNKVVLDLGCNVGGMLHAIANDIKAGYGFDFNPNCINAAVAIKRLNASNNLDFFTLDLDNQDLSLINSLLLGNRPDICFLLSVCRWLENWKEVVQAASAMSEVMLFESNGSAEQQRAQVELLKTLYEDVAVVKEGSTDDVSVVERVLYFCQSKRL